MDGWFDVGTVSDEGVQMATDSEKIFTDTMAENTWTTTYTSWGSGPIAKWVEPDIIDKIDEVLTPPLKCPHCSRDWHPGPLTRTVVNMLESHRFSPGYNPDTDESDILCVGAEYHGPNRPRIPNWLNEVIATTTQKWVNEMATVTWPTWTFTSTHSMWVSGFHDAGSWWKPPKPKPCELPENLPTIEFGPQNWTPPTDPVALPQPVKHLVWSYWDDLTQQNIPTPERPGYDFSQYAEEISYPTNGKKAWK